MFCKLHHSTRVPNLCSSGLICKSTKSGLTTWEDMTLTQIKVGTCSVKTRSWRKSLPYLNSVPGTWNNEQSTHPPEVFLGLPTIWQNLHTLTKQKKSRCGRLDQEGWREQRVLYFITWSYRKGQSLHSDLTKCETSWSLLQQELITGNVWLEQTGYKI